MLHAENSRIQSHPVTAIEGQSNTGTMFVKPLLGGDNMALIEVHIPAGVWSSHHVHAHESLLYVVSGKLITKVNNDTFILGPGDVCRHPVGVSHNVEALEDTVFVEVKSPPIDFHKIFDAPDSTDGVQR